MGRKINTFSVMCGHLEEKKRDLCKDGNSLIEIVFGGWMIEGSYCWWLGDPEDGEL